MSVSACSTMGSMNFNAGYWELRGIAEYYGVSVRTVQRWVCSGEFPPPFKLGRKRLWIPEQVREWMLRRGTEAKAEAEKEWQRLANYSWKGGK